MPGATGPKICRIAFVQLFGDGGERVPFRACEKGHKAAQTSARRPTFEASTFQGCSGPLLRRLDLVDAGSSREWVEQQRCPNRSCFVVSGPGSNAIGTFAPRSKNSCSWN